MLDRGLMLTDPVLDFTVRQYGADISAPVFSLVQIQRRPSPTPNTGVILDPRAVFTGRKHGPCVRSLCVINVDDDAVV